MVCSLNANRSNTAMQAAMHTISNSVNPTFKLLLVQEPWWEKITNSYGTVSFPGWQTILPKRPLAEHERPRVVAYYKTGTRVEITLRNDIITDLDTMVLEIKREGSDKDPTRLINIYNQKPLGDQPQTGWTVDRLALANLEPVMTHSQPLRTDVPQSAHGCFPCTRTFFRSVID